MSSNESDVLEDVTVQSTSTAPPDSSGSQYGRKISLVVSDASGQNGYDLSQFRIRFQIQRGDYQQPNTANIRVYNLKDETANLLSQPEFSQLTLSAGYQNGNYGVIFLGSISQARRGRENQLDSYVDFTAGDGDESYNYATVNASMSASSNTAQGALNTLLEGMRKQAAARPGAQSLEIGYVGQLTAKPPPRGRSYYGSAKDELRNFALNNDMTWSLQDGKFFMIPKSSYIKGKIASISPDTGLIGIPEQTANGVNVRVLLNPVLAIGYAIQIQPSVTINQYQFGLDVESIKNNYAIQRSNKLNGQGLYYVMCANHFGDTRGNEWYTDLTCLAIDASLPINNDDYLNANFINPGPIPRYSGG